MGGHFQADEQLWLHATIPRGQMSTGAAAGAGVEPFLGAGQSPPPVGGEASASVPHPQPWHSPISAGLKAERDPFLLF